MWGSRPRWGRARASQGLGRRDEGGVWEWPAPRGQQPPRSGLGARPVTGTLGSWLGPFFAALRLVGERRGQRPLSGLHRAGPLRVLGGSTVISTASRALGGLMPRAGGPGHGPRWARRVEQVAAGAGGPGSLPRPPQVLTPGSRPGLSPAPSHRCSHPTWPRRVLPAC